MTASTPTQRPPRPSAKHFPGLSRAVKQLTVSPDSVTLFHTAQHKLTVWDIAGARSRFRLEGELQGVSNDGQTFLTRHIDPGYLHKDAQTPNRGLPKALQGLLEPPCIFRAWETRTGSEIALPALNPDTYLPYQRTTVFANRNAPAFRVKDLLSGEHPRVIPISNMPDSIAENWLLTPDAGQIVAVYYVGAGGFERIFGHCHPVKPNRKEFSFTASSNDNNLPPFFISTEHNLLLSHHYRNYDLYDLETGEHLRTVSGDCGRGKSVAFNPKDKWQIAIGNYSDVVVVAKIARVPEEDTVINSIKQSDAIVDLAFLPDGIRLATLLKAGKICIWNTQTGQLTATLSG